MAWYYKNNICGKTDESLRRKATGPLKWQHSPVDYFNKYPGRFTVLHIKDDKEIGDSGMVGFDAIFRNAKVAGVKHIVAEIEGYSCPVEVSVKKSLDYLLDAPFVKASYSK